MVSFGAIDVEVGGVGDMIRLEACAAIRCMYIGATLRR